MGAALVGQAVLYPWQDEGWVRGTVARRSRTAGFSHADRYGSIWKPIPVRIFYTFVIYQGYDMDILSGKSYDVIYHDMTWIS